MKLRIPAILTLFLSSAGIASGAPVDVKVHMPADTDDAGPSLEVHNGKTYAMQSDGDGGSYTVTVDIDSSRYATVYYGKTSTLLWLAPGDSVDISLGRKDEPSVIDGNHADVNRYLNSNPYRFAAINDTGRDEDEFLHFVDSINTANRHILDMTGLPLEFKAQEADRIYYGNALALSFYPEFHPRLKPDPAYEPSEKFYEAFRAATRYEARLLASREYTNYIINSLGQLSRQAMPERKGFDRFTAYLDSCVRDPKVAEYIFNRSASSMLTRRGIEEAREYIDAYPRYVTDSTLTAGFRQLYNEIDGLSPGRPSPAFDCETTDGSRRRLSDYAGRWVYVDIWATWCGPCRREIPHLEKLEHKYAGQPIAFVSISADTDREAWAALVTSRQMKGEQLHFDGRDSFRESYKVNGIPRFILIDPEGRIADPDMTRPSDPATAETFDRLLKRDGAN